MDLLNKTIVALNCELGFGSHVADITAARDLVQDMYDALCQWQNAERDNDAEEFYNARNSRDKAIFKAIGGDA